MSRSRKAEWGDPGNDRRNMARPSSDGWPWMRFYPFFQRGVMAAHVVGGDYLVAAQNAEHLGVEFGKCPGVERKDLSRIGEQRDALVFCLQ